jgi:hypothetical protein
MQNSGAKMLKPVSPFPHTLNIVVTQLTRTALNSCNASTKSDHIPHLDPNYTRSSVNRPSNTTKLIYNAVQNSVQNLRSITYLA